MPNGMMFSIGTWSMIFAAGWLLDRVRLTGSTTSDDGATPKLHIRVAPLTTWIGMVSSPVGAVGARAYRLRLLAGGPDLDPAVFSSRRIALVAHVAACLADGLQEPGVDALLHQVIAHRARAPLREPLVVAGRAHAIRVADDGEAAILELRRRQRGGQVLHGLQRTAFDLRRVESELHLQRDRGRSEEHTSELQSLM